MSTALRERPALEVADVIRDYGAAFLDRYGGVLSAAQRQALRDLAACRTALLGGHVTQGGGSSAQQQIIQHCRVGQGEVRDGGRQGEDHVMVFDRQEVLGLLVEPAGTGQGLALGAVAVAAGVVGQAFVAAGGAVFPVPAQSSGAAGLDGLQDLQVRPGQAVRRTVIRTVAAHDVGQLTRRLWPCPGRCMTACRGHGG